MEELIEKTYLSNLFCFYKNLLTEKQRECFESYYNQDFSLSEIAESENVSRSAIYDNLKKTVQILKDYEEKLGLYKNYLLRKDYLSELEKHTDKEGLEIIQKINEMEQ